MRIAFLISPNMLVTSFTNAYELFFAANQTVKLLKVAPPSLASDEDATASVRRQVELVKVSPLQTRTTLASGLSLLPDQALSEDVFDMVYLPALWRNPRPIIKRHPEIVEWVRWQYEHGAIINATGTGVCFLAETGLLNDRPATTHWYYFDQFVKDYPLVQLKRQHFITTSGNIYCAASVNALTDLTLHHVHRYFGAAVSEHLSRHFSHEVRQPFDSLSFNAEENTNHPDEIVLQAQLWIQNHLSKSAISIRGLAELFGMSQRTFNRRFKLATNMTPVQYLQTRRIDAAKELLRTSNLSIKEISYRVGYIDVSYFTKLFKEFASMTPRKYRTTVRAKLFSSG
jgi:transcriptional regulator GlxA family with amidase domain